MKLNKLALLVIAILFGYNVNSQCNSNISICTPGTAGPFNFTNITGPPTDYANTSCGVGIGPISNNTAFIVLNITSSGPLNLLIDGNTTTGYLDVVVFNIPPGTPPCTAVMDANNEIGCNYADWDDGCVEFGTSFGCSSSVPAPNVNAGDQIMIIVNDYSGLNSSFTMDLGPTGAQTGPPNPTITPVGTTSCNDAPFQLTAVSAGGTWSGPGVTATGMFDPAAAGVGNHTINYNVGNAPCNAASSTTINVTCNCSFTFINANVSACDALTGTYSTSGQVDFTNPPATGQLVIEDCNGNQDVYNAPFSGTGSQNYTIIGQNPDGNALYFSPTSLHKYLVRLTITPFSLTLF